MGVWGTAAFLFALLAAVGCRAGEGAQFDGPRLAFHECSVLRSGVGYALAAKALCVRGPTDYTLAKDFTAYVKNVEKLGLAVDYVVISGPGGEMRSAISIAKGIESGRYDVVVGDICASSCAQFLFVAGRRKYVLKGGAALFHGGPIPESKIKEMHLPASAEESIRNQNREFERFYKDRGVEMRLVTEPPDSIRRRLAAGEIVMWSLPGSKLAELGVTDVYEEQ